MCVLPAARGKADISRPPMQADILVSGASTNPLVRKVQNLDKPVAESGHIHCSLSTNIILLECDIARLSFPMAPEQTMTTVHDSCSENYGNKQY